MMIELWSCLKLLGHLTINQYKIYNKKENKMVIKIVY